MVIVFGSINVDLIVRVERLPAPGETVIGAALKIEAGGKGANQALAAARDGARVIMAGAIGDDPLAIPALALLKASSVDLSRIASVASSTGAAAITVDAEGANQITVAAGANRLARAAQVEDAILNPQATLLLQMEIEPDEAAALIPRARARGARIILNLAPPRELPREVLSMVDILLVNETEAAELAARFATSVAALSSRLGVGVVRTLGAHGVVAGIAGTEFHIPATPVTAIDTTAAGDCFAGVFAAALDAGRPLKDALRRASLAAALSCTRQGSQRSLPTAAEIDAASVRAWGA